MIIADLNHFEVVAQDVNVTGSRGYIFFPTATAKAFADAAAVGFFTKTISATVTEAAAGVFSRSSSYSKSQAVG
ncbi:MAG: hypothetical protein MUC48_09920 [Leptolyngbya sp. Prado105]|jgi:hypothetical protein|nr:hypothetical protein [Leptolyngbya sp. Prado105]